MAAPTVTASLDKPSYAPGAKMTLTVSYADADNHTVKIDITVTDSTGAKGSTSVSVSIADPSTLVVSDSDGRVWTKVSDTGSVAVFTATA